MPNILEAANQSVIDDVRKNKASQFTVGGFVKDGKLHGGVTFDRTWKNGWGVTAYARAYWDDLPVSVQRKPTVEAGAELVKKF